MKMFIVAVCISFTATTAGAQEKLDYAPADPELQVVRLDSHPTASFLAVRCDSMGRLFVGGREALFVYEPDGKNGYKKRAKIFKFPDHTWVYDIAIRGHDLYIMTVSALYKIPNGVVQRKNLKIEKLVWGVPMGHVHQCFHALAWGPEGDLYFSMGDPLWYYGDFNRPDHWGHWTMFCQPEGTKIPYTGVGAVFRCKPDGSKLQIVARGLRNSCGLCFDRDWNLFTNDNDHESLPGMYVPGRLLHVTPGAYFSWPRGWLATKTPDRHDLLETMFTGMGRAVPVGMTYYDETFLPKKYRHNLLVARWGTRQITRYPLTRKGATFKATEHALLIGKNNARPVGVCVGRGGRIFATIAYMAHNEASPVYKSDLVMITKKGDDGKAGFEPYDVVKADANRLIGELAHSSWLRRYQAHVELIRQGDNLYQRMSYKQAKKISDAHVLWLWAKYWKESSDSDNQETMDKDVRFRLGLIYPNHTVSLEYPKIGHPSCINLVGYLAGIRDKAPAKDQRTVLNGLNYLRKWHGKTPNKLLSDINGNLKAIHRPAIKNPWELAVRFLVPSDDTYIRQAACMFLAEKAPRDVLAKMCIDKNAKIRLAGVLAAGFRLTIPPATAPIPKRLPLSPLREESAYVIEYADGKIDLRKFGRIGNFTVAEHWKAGGHSPEQKALFDLLFKRLDDRDEKVRLQAAHFLSLLNDPRSEPKIAKLYAATLKRRLLTSPIHTVKDAWIIGPFPDGKDGLKKIHAIERGPIDLAKTYKIAGKNLKWKTAKTKRIYDFYKLYGDCDQSSFYAYTRLESSGKTKAMLLVGSDDGVKIWHNGKLVWTHDIERGALPFQDVIILDLEPGGNDILARVNNKTGTCGLYMHYRHLGNVTARLPEKLSIASLADRLKSAKNAKLDKRFFTTDWSQAVKKGDPKNGRQLFQALSCIKCHAVDNQTTTNAGPSLAEAHKRFTIPYLVESILAPDKQVSPVFKATFIETKAGKTFTGLVVNETGDKLEMILQDAKQVVIAKADVANRAFLPISPMPAGVVRTPEELRDLLAFLMRD